MYASRPLLSLLTKEGSFDVSVVSVGDLGSVGELVTEGGSTGGAFFTSVLGAATGLAGASGVGGAIATSTGGSGTFS